MTLLLAIFFWVVFGLWSFFWWNYKRGIPEFNVSTPLKVVASALGPFTFVIGYFVYMGD